MERIKILLQHMIQSAKIQGNEDLEIATRTLLGAIDRDCLSEFADSCIDFAEKKVTQRMMEEN